MAVLPVARLKQNETILDKWKTFLGGQVSGVCFILYPVLWEMAALGELA